MDDYTLYGDYPLDTKTYNNAISDPDVPWYTKESVAYGYVSMYGTLMTEYELDEARKYY